MKSKVLLIGLLLLTCSSFSQTVVTLNAAADANVTSHAPNATHGNWEALFGAMDNFSANDTVRSVIKFDLSSIPSNAVILSASLRLYGYEHYRTAGVSNDCDLLVNTQSWTEYGVTWNNAPSYTYTNAVSLSGSPVGTTYSDYTLDVTNAVKYWQNGSVTNNGWTLKLHSESPTTDRYLSFKSKEYEPAKLKIEYKIPTCTLIYPDKDAYVHEFHSNTNYGNHSDLLASLWTFGGNWGARRFYIEGDFSGIPTNAVVVSSELRLTGINSSSNGPNACLTGDNDGWLQLATSSWTELGIVWDNQPNLSTTGQIYLPKHCTMQNRTVDITTWTQNWVTNPSSNHGFAARMNKENDQKYRRLTYASSDHDSSNYHPEIEVCYYIPGTKSIINKPLSLDRSNQDVSISMYPNPASNAVTLELDGFKTENTTLELYSINGQIIQTNNITNDITRIDISKLPRGIYFAKIHDGNSVIVKKLILTTL